ncbi:MAG: sigma-70 family RNA polymerase sigma factor [Erysipelotrichaceae bacterium]|nr:sigma-70 family RNA polymerase sigma factor [Erysipelotrichaceae bacterium]
MYNNCNDYELLYYIHQKDDEGLHLLMKKYHRVILQFIRKYKAYYCYRYNDHTEIYQISLIILLEAIQCYRFDKKLSFYNFYLMKLKYAFIDRLRKEKFGNMLSLDYQVCETSDTYLVDTLENQDPSLDADWLVRLEEISKIKQCFEKQFSDIERKVFHLRYEGYSYREIAQDLHISTKKVDNILQKVRKKKGLIDYKSTL